MRIGWTRITPGGAPGTMPSPAWWGKGRLGPVGCQNSATASEQRLQATAAYSQILYLQRWLAAPLQRSDASRVERDRGTPQGSAVPPPRQLLAERGVGPTLPIVRLLLCPTLIGRQSELDVLVGPGRRPRGSTRSSIALGRTSDTTENSLRTCRKITYSNRSDSPGSCPTGNHRWSATQARPLTPHRAKQLDIEPLPPEAPISAPRVDGPAVDRPQDPASPESQRLPQSCRVAVRDIGNNSDFFEAQVFRETSTVLLEDAGQKRGDEET